MRFLALYNFRTRDPANQRHQGIQPQNPSKKLGSKWRPLDEILEVPLGKINRKNENNVTSSYCAKYYCLYRPGMQIYVIVFKEGVRTHLENYTHVYVYNHKRVILQPNKNIFKN